MADTKGNDILVVYYSLSGNTARVARDLAAQLGADVESIRDSEHGTGFRGYMRNAWDAWRSVPARVHPLAKNPAMYALTIIGTPVWVSHMTPAVRGYLTQFGGACRNVAFFTTSGNTDVSKLLPSLEQVAKKKSLAATGFNARELSDEVGYRKKLDAFVTLIRSRSSVAGTIGTGARAA